MPRYPFAAGVLIMIVAVADGRAQPAGTDAPTSVEDCLKQLQELVDEAHAIDLLDDQIDQAENYVALMERSCLAGEFSQAMAFAAEVRKIIATNK